MPWNGREERLASPDGQIPEVIITMPIYTVAGLLLLVSGCFGFHLASPNQRYFATAWRRQPTRALSAALLGFSWLSLCQEMQVLTAAFVFATAAMLTLTSLPFITALRAKQKETR